MIPDKPQSMNLDAERAVLAAILLDAKHLRTAADILIATDFIDPRHRLIWTVIGLVAMSGGIPDVVNVTQGMRVDGAERVATSYLAELLNEVPAVANVAEHAQIVAGHSRVRRVERACQLIAAQARTGVGDVDAWAHESLLQMTAACAGAQRAPTAKTVRELLTAAAEEALTRRRQEFCTALHWRLDEATGGMRPGHVWVFGAETNWGKSSYLVGVADENLRRGKKVLIVSAEDSESIYGNRLMARRARVNFSRLRDRCLHQDETDRMMLTAQQGETLPVFIDARGRDIEAVCREVETMITEHGVDLVAWDYLQEFRTKERHQDERVKYREIAAQMRNVTKNAHIAGLILSQITVSETKKTPDKHSIRECRDVSNAAEVVVLGFTPEADIKDSDQKVLVAAGRKCIKVDKAKDGQKRNVEMDWDHDSACFDVTERPRSEAETEANSLGDEYDQTGRYE